ncbi:MAG: hypothetical protein ACOC44_18290 [Promethearchaeia archaeon]
MTTLKKSEILNAIKGGAQGVMEGEESVSETSEAIPQSEMMGIMKEFLRPFLNNVGDSLGKAVSYKLTDMATSSNKSSNKPKQKPKPKNEDKGGDEMKNNIDEGQMKEKMGELVSWIEKQDNDMNVAEFKEKLANEIGFPNWETLKKMAEAL